MNLHAKTANNFIINITFFIEKYFESIEKIILNLKWNINDNFYKNEKSLLNSILLERE